MQLDTKTGRTRAAITKAPFANEWGFYNVLKESDAFDRDRNALTDADTHRAESETALRALQLIHRRGHEPRAAHAERMTKRNRAAVRIHASVIVRDTQRAQYRDSLRCERLVQFDHVELI